MKTHTPMETHAFLCSFLDLCFMQARKLSVETRALQDDGLTLDLIAFLTQTLSTTRQANSLPFFPQALPGEYAAIAEALETKMKKELSFEADISEFINATKTDKAGPVPIKYLPHGKPAEEELDSTAPAPAPAASSSSPVAEEGAEAPVEAAVSAGTEAAPFAVPEESAAEKE